MLEMLGIFFLPFQLIVYVRKKKIGEKEKIWTYPYSGLDWTDWILLKKRVLLEHLAVLKTSTYHTHTPIPDICR